MGISTKSKLVKLMELLEKYIPKGDNTEYSIPELWNCFDYSGKEKNVKENGITIVNPYKFYHHCIRDFIMKKYNPDIDYSNSISIINENHEFGKEYMGGDWIKKSSIYSMHVRTSTSFDHDGSGILEDSNKNGFKEAGTFIKSIALIPLLKKMGIDTVYLLPITKHSVKFKKGELGSPYAVKNFFKLDFELKDTITGNEFTVEEEFLAFVEACHVVGIRVMIDIIPRTCARDNDLIMEHPDWFYWIRYKDVNGYKPPYINGINPIEKPSLDNLHEIYSAAETLNHIEKFTLSPDKFDAYKWFKLKELYQNDKSMDFLEYIEKEIGLTTAPAFSDCINDPQPIWSDITYFRFYWDTPIESQKFIKGNENPYILFDTIKCNLFKGNLKNEELWDNISNIIPYFQNNFGIDGARIDMGHALPEKLVHSIIDNARNKDEDFSFIAEELNVFQGEMAIKVGYNMIVGSGWWFEPRVLEGKTHEFMYNTKFYKAPVYACSETSDTPRIAARVGGKPLAKMLTIMNEFLPNTVPFINSGIEIYEVQPMNIGLDCSEDEKYRLDKTDIYNGKLAFFDKYQLHWSNPLRWDIPDTLSKVSYFRKMYMNTFIDSKNFVPITSEHIRNSYIGLGWIIDGEIKEKDNLFCVIANMDLNSDKTFVVDITKVREKSGNISKKAWLGYSTDEWSHDIYDFDKESNLELNFKPGEVKILII